MKKAGIALKISNCQNSPTKAEVNELKINTAKQISISFLGLRICTKQRDNRGAKSYHECKNTRTPTRIWNTYTENFWETIGIIPIIPSSVLKIPNTPKQNTRIIWVFEALFKFFHFILSINIFKSIKDESRSKSIT